MQLKVETDSQGIEQRHGAWDIGPLTDAAMNSANFASDPLALEVIALNLEATLRIYSPHHFFSWTQGLMQSMLAHEVLICAINNEAVEASQVECYAAAPLDAKRLSKLYCEEPALIDALVSDWEVGRCLPLIYDLRTNTRFETFHLVRELNLLGASVLAVHGTYDIHGRMRSFFLFACRPSASTTDHLMRIEMLVPFLHAAWVRSKFSQSSSTTDGNALPDNRHLLTAREQEVLQWIYLGKGNIEIGLILGISPLTVKNHVQEILRRLNVQNRTQAVGKAFALHILSC
jgi:transcriptional regulator EpsA